MTGAAVRSPTKEAPVAAADAGPGTAAGRAPGRRFPLLPAALAVVLAAFVLLPPVRGQPRLVATFLGVAGTLLAWSLLLWAVNVRRQRIVRLEVSVARAHWVQACAQACILAYWGWYVPEVYAQLPLVLAQVLFLYAFDALLTWSRGRTWRLGFGPLPIIFSTNLLLWFRADWYFLQFAMVATGALGKQFVQWRREGRRTHIFNPSTFGQFLFAIVLIATGTTEKLTWGKEIAAWFDTPTHIFTLLFLVGLVVQGLFAVTLVTVSAVAMLVVLNVSYTQATGVYYFLSSNLGAAIFLGVHLLITDPATSPRTNAGRVIFGALYGALYFVFYRVLDDLGVPLFWDKLLPVPFLNLCVPLIDRVARHGLVGRFNRWWETAFRPARANLVHMGCWAALFGTMLATGYVEAPHPGASIVFWKRAWDEGKPLADRNLKKLVLSEASLGSGPAYNLLGMMYTEGKLLPQNPAAAAQCFARACDLGDPQGCMNVAVRFLSDPTSVPQAVAAQSLSRIEPLCRFTNDGQSCFLIGLAYERGLLYPQDRERALQLYEESCRQGYAPACQRLGR